PAGTATLGQTGTADETFGWDNERGALEVDVPHFAIESHNITNADFLRFVQAHGYQNRSLWTAEGWAWKEKEGIAHPAFWHHEGNIWMYRAMFGQVRLPLEWPVYVSHAEATAYANWLGRKLPSEAQFHRAAYGAPNSNSERQYPWGDSAPNARHGN